MWRTLALALITILLMSCHRDKAVTPDGLAVSTVKTTTVKERRVQQPLVLNGILKADQDVVIKAETQGKVVMIAAKMGDRVTTGQLLASIDDTIKRATMEASRANLAKLEKDLDRVTDLVAQKAATSSEQDTVRLAVDTARSQYTIAAKDWENTRILAPFTGVITESWVAVGAMLSPGASVFHLINLDQLKVTVSVNERFISLVHPGTEVTLSPEFQPQTSLKGRVRAISPQATGAQNFPVEVLLSRQESSIFLDGMSVKVAYNFPDRSIQALPRTALVGSIQEPQVYVVSEGRAQRRSIQVGESYDTDIEVIAGLQSGDAVVISGQNLVEDGTPVEVTP